MQINAILAMPTIVSNVLSIVVAILILLLTITVHELGHYVVGKLLKFKIEEFAIGMGPALFKRTLKNGEVFSIRIFPLGGYCAFEGEDQEYTKPEENADNAHIEALNQSENAQTPVFEGIEEQKSADRAAQYPAVKKPLSENAFNNKKPWQRILVLLAGATMNFIFAIILSTAKFVAYGHFELSPSEVLPSPIVVDDGLQSGDIITYIDGRFVYLTTDYVDALNGKKKGDLVKLGVIRDGEKKTVTVSLSSDVRCESIGDITPCFDALGFGTVVTVSTRAGSPIEDGAYLFRFGDYEDEARYQECERIFSLKDLAERLAALSGGETLKIWTYKDGDENRKLVSLTAPENFDSVDKSSNKSVLAAFGIEDTPKDVGYNVSTASIKLGFFESVGRSFIYSFKTLYTTLSSFGQLITGRLSITSVSGPIGTVSITSSYVSSWRFDYILEIAALIGVSIAIFNVLPIPALDGARVVFVVIEWIRGKPINRNVEGMIHFIGLIALIVFAVAVDVIKLFI